MYQQIRALVKGRDARLREGVSGVVLLTGFLWGEVSVEGLRAGKLRAGREEGRGRDGPGDHLTESGAARFLAFLRDPLLLVFPARPRQ